MYQNLVVGNLSGAEDSVHLMRLPRAATSAESIPSSKTSMEEVMDVVQLGRACRNAANIKVRQRAGHAVRKGLGAGFRVLPH